MLSAWLGWVVRLDLGKIGGSELGFWYGRLIGTIIGAVERLPLGTCDGTVIRSLEGFIDGAVICKYLCLCCCRGYVHM